jgi:hypothetical protein
MARAWEAVEGDFGQAELSRTSKKHRGKEQRDIMNTVYIRVWLAVGSAGMNKCAGKAWTQEDGASQVHHQ